MLWYGEKTGFLMSLFFPIMPLVLTGAQVVKKVKSIFDPSDWAMDGPGRVFFLKPENPLGSFIWDCYLTQSMYVGQFFLVGTHPDAMSHTWDDTLLTKDYWRKNLNEVDARVPRELGRWEQGKLEMFHELKNEDLVIKLEDAYLGIGDNFWDSGKDFTDVASLTALLAKTYNTDEFKHRTAMVLEMVRPKKKLGVHSLDIITMRTPNDDVKIISVLLWADCTTNSSHSTQAGYTVDIATETVVAPAGWYSPFFTKMDTPLIGTKYSGVKEACEKAVLAHKASPYKWLIAIGWDAMIMEGEEVVFFEGNFAGARTPRRMFLSANNFIVFMKEFFWPFGKGNSVRPDQQHFKIN